MADLYDSLCQLVSTEGDGILDDAVRLKSFLLDMADLSPEGQLAIARGLDDEYLAYLRKCLPKGGDRLKDEQRRAMAQEAALLMTRHPQVTPTSALAVSHAMVCALCDLAEKVPEGRQGDLSGNEASSADAAEISASPQMAESAVGHRLSYFNKNVPCPGVFGGSVSHTLSTLLMTAVLAGLVALPFIIGHVTKPRTYTLTCRYVSSDDGRDIRPADELELELDSDYATEPPSIPEYAYVSYTVEGADAAAFGSTVTVDGRSATGDVRLTFVYDYNEREPRQPSATLLIRYLDIDTGKEIATLRREDIEYAATHTVDIPQVTGYAYVYATINSAESSMASENIPLIFDVLEGRPFTANLFYRRSRDAVSVADADGDGGQQTTSRIGGNATSWVLPYSSIREYTREELDATLSDFGLFIARNEIYARHGVIFDNVYLDTYFAGRAWYQPLTSDAEGRLSALEVRNAQTILEVERSRRDGTGTQYLDSNYVGKLPLYFTEDIRRKP